MTFTRAEQDFIVDALNRREMDCRRAAAELDAEADRARLDRIAPDVYERTRTALLTVAEEADRLADLIEEADTLRTVGAA